MRSHNFLWTRLGSGLVLLNILLFAATASGQLSVTPSTVNFGNVPIGGNASQSVTLTNTGSRSLTIYRAAVDGTAFSLSGISLPLTLAVGQSGSLTTTFAPQASGGSNGSIFLEYSGAEKRSLQFSQRTTVLLTGTGTGAGQLTVNPSSLGFGNVQVGSSQTLSATLGNSGGSSLTISQATLSGPGFTLNGIALPLTIGAGQSVAFSVTFAPQSAGSSSGNVAFVSNASNSTMSLPLSGTGVTPGLLTASPSSQAFGSVQVGTSQPLTSTLTNSGGSSLTISAASESGPGFSFTGLSLPLTLTAGQSTSFTVLFSPTTSGAATGSITITSTASDTTLSIPLSGTGVTQGTLTANPTTLPFGNVQVGASTNLSGTLTNTGGASLTISAAAASGTGFSLSGLSLPLTLTAGQSTSFKVTFSPTVSGTASGSVSVTSNGSNPNLSIPLSGTGTTPGFLSANPTTLSFGNVQVGSSTNLSETLTNTGGSSLTISAAVASGTGFSLSGLSLPLTLTAGQSSSFTVTFSPTVSGSASGSVSVTSNGSNPNLSIPLSGTGATPGFLSANPTTLSFGSVQVGASTNLSETLTNTGATSVIISQANLSGTGFSLSGLNLPLTLTASQSVTFTATFAPTAAGAASGSVSVVSNASDSPLTINLSGTGTAAGTLAVSPTSLSFGNVTVGSSASLNGSLTASGTAVTVSSASLTNGEFILSGISMPVTIPSGQSTTFAVTFKPQASGATSASLSFSSNASNSPTVQSMTGTGAAAVQHTVDLSWTASPDVVGYNIYRGTVAGGPYAMINTSLDGSTTYTDGTVVSGTTYYYVATAVNSESQDSGYSNQAQAIVPNP